MEKLTIDENLKQNLQREIPVLRAQIRALYEELDCETGLQGADVPIVFGYEEEVLGSYKRGAADEKAHFYFSLLFIGYSVKDPLSKEDRIDLFKHEYAHYMQYHMEIPEKYLWQPGIHGSAWKYCCSIVGAAPTPYYKAGESLMKHNYEKALSNSITNKHVPLVDQHRREQAYRQQKNSVVHYQIGDGVTHPKFGQGVIEEIKTGNGSVRLKVRFGEEQKIIDQNWLMRSQYSKAGNK